MYLINQFRHLLLAQLYIPIEYPEGVHIDVYLPEEEHGQSAQKGVKLTRSESGSF